MIPTARGVSDGCLRSRCCRTAIRRFEPIPLHESERTRVTRLFLAGRTVIREQPLGSDAVVAAGA